MFDFEKLEVYNKIREMNKELLPWILKNQNKDNYLCDQLKRASLSAMLNLSEGAGRMSVQDKKQFYIRARASIFESVSILHVLSDLEIMDDNYFNLLYDRFEEISKMLLGMIRNVSENIK
ncbi:MAG: four helix bundle protein [Saprospiraceae bacterium]|nr:four helix bundle protein [Saprospiraceae bacterium]